MDTTTDLRTPTDVLELSDSDFAAIVLRDLRNRLPSEVVSLLETEEVVHRWWTRLDQMIEQSVRVMESKDAKHTANQLQASDPTRAAATDAKHLRLKAKALRFQAIARQRQLHVGALITRYARTEGLVVERLTNAIKKHRETLDRQPEPADSRLWAVLEDL